MSERTQFHVLTEDLDHVASYDSVYLLALRQAARHALSKALDTTDIFFVGETEGEFARDKPLRLRVKIDATVR